jgi:bifunctional DNase/RNase
VVVTEVRDHTFFAELHLTTPAGPQVISSRPSDAIALAVRFGASLFAEEELLDEVGQVPAPEPEDEAEEIIDEFKDFIEHVSPEDFAG